MAKAIWNGRVIAESDHCLEVEGNLYFPPDSVDAGCLPQRATHALCGWKGRANYYDVTVAGKINRDAAWYYPEPEPAAVRGYVAFWRGVDMAP